MSDNDIQDTQDTRIAVVGLAGRFPGAADVEQFWRNLLDGVDSITRGAPQPVPGGRGSYVPARGVVADADLFDANYFGYTPRDALIISPQHRVLLECAVEAFEHAGHDPARFDGAIGVYAGGTETAYAHLLRAQRDQLPSVTDLEILLGSGQDFLVSRIAYKLGLRGPAVAVQAACATALVAVHTAIQALLAGDCDLALAGGVSISAPTKQSPYVEGGIIAADGVCRTFDAAAGGTVGSDGAGLVVLRRLADALADGDHVHAVLRGSAINNDGPDRIGFTAPSVSGQAAVIRDAQLVADVDARSIGYVEAHGTATPLGDPIEIAALRKAFAEDTDATGYCAIGSVKTNIGHTDAAAGAAGLIKTVLAVERGTIPPSLHYTEPNPGIDFANSPFRVATTAEEWAAPRRAGVSSFGMGGVNAHVIVDQAPQPAPTAPARPHQLIALSARTPAALDAVTARLAAHVRAHPDLPIADIAWTLQVGRKAHQLRRHAVVAGRDELFAALAEPGKPIIAGSPSVTFLFPADGGRLHTRRLYHAEPAFHAAVEECLGELSEADAKAVRAFIGTGRPAGEDVLTFIQQYALAALWRHWGVRPAAVLGTGVGQLVAATVTGTLTVSAALNLIAHEDLPAQEDLGPSVSALLGTPNQLVLHVGAGAAEDDRIVATLPEEFDALGLLWSAGVPVDWAAVHDGGLRNRVVLPSYPFERARHLVEPAARKTEAVAPQEESASDRLAPTPTALAELIARTLELPAVGTEENFFDLGGDSLVAVSLISDVRQLFGADLDLDAVMEAPTATGLAALVDAAC